MSKLYLVATPIGNLGDISQRAASTLEQVDFIAAEDTRVTRKLLSHLGISKPMVSYYQHNLNERGELIVERILSGECCALVSDAGMPAISDPGERLVELCVQNNIEVSVIPGPTAALTALVVSGLGTSRFCFEGFLCVNRAARHRRLKRLEKEERTMIFYEAPHKIKRTLADMAAVFGGSRRVCIARELTKIYEQVLRLSLDEAVEYFDQNSPRGEFVLVVEGAAENKNQAPDIDRAIDFAQELLESGQSASAAARLAAEQFGARRNQIYKILTKSED